MELAKRSGLHPLASLRKKWHRAPFRGSLSQLVPSSSGSRSVEWRKFARRGARVKETRTAAQTLGGATVRTQMIATSHVP